MVISTYDHSQIGVTYVGNALNLSGGQLWGKYPAGDGFYSARQYEKVMVAIFNYQLPYYSRPDTCCYVFLYRFM